jgi:radical SAM superfamily enzyme YgiQ (UPF0313 family)
MKEFSPDIVVHEVATASIKTDLENGRLVKETLPDSTLVFCGAHYAMFGGLFMKEESFVDIVVRGEYEFSLLGIADALKNGEPLSTVDGINYREGEKIKKNRDRALADISELPLPARDLLPMDLYWDNPGGMPEPTLQIHASRGCPYTCVFCAWPQIMYGGNKYRARDPKDVVDEIVECVGLYGYKSFYIDDDTFNVGKKRVIEFCDLLIKSGVKIPWSVMARADTTDFETLVKMKEAGLCAIKYGIESGDQEILDNSGKSLDLEVARRTVAETKRLGLKCHLTFLFGLPGETDETVRKTMELAFELGSDTAQFSIVTPFPGSILYDDLKDKGYLVSENFDEYDGNNRSVIRTDALTAKDLEDILKNSTSRWYRKTLFKRVWGSKVYFFKEFAKHPIGTIKMAKRTLFP